MLSWHFIINVIIVNGIWVFGLQLQEREQTQCVEAYQQDKKMQQRAGNHRGNTGENNVRILQQMVHDHAKPEETPQELLVLRS
jgi:hypothetical protein